MCRSYHVTFAQPFNTHDDEDDDESRATLFIHSIGSERKVGRGQWTWIKVRSQAKSFMSEFDIMRVDLDISFVFVANLTRSLFS